ncbi:MAG: geranylgeranyl diphosphate reductase [Pseudomonadota bacterium]
MATLKHDTIYDAAVIGGGPAGATAAHDLASQGARVLLIDRAGRIKPCGGAIPPKLLREFNVPEHLLVAKAKSATIISPSNRHVNMPIEGGMVGMVDREHFDEWLRERAETAGADRMTGRFRSLEENEDGTVSLKIECADNQELSVCARQVIGADGARSEVVRQAFPKAERVPFVFAYHEIIESPIDLGDAFAGDRCDIYYNGKFSPDFYSWVFPHGNTTSIGTGSAQKGFNLRDSIQRLRKEIGLDGQATARCEGAPIPLKPLKRWDNGRNILVIGDAAGVVAPASGEGIYYAMACGRMGAEAAAAALQTGDARALAGARKQFMKAHGRVFFILGIMQKFWYANDKRRERFTSICADKDVQRLTWEAYMNKKLVKADHMAHARIFFKDLAHLFGLVSPQR